MSGAGTSRTPTVKPTNELEGKGTTRKAKETPTRPNSTHHNAAIKGLAPQVKLRPPATSSTITIPPTPEDAMEYDDSFLTEEDDDILNSSLLTPKQKLLEDPEETDPNVGEKLLTLRKEYKKVAVALTKATVHFPPAQIKGKPQRASTSCKAV